MELFLDGKVQLFSGDCREQLKLLADNSVDAGVMDPPYALVSIGKRFGADDAAPAKVGKTGAYARASAGFMGKKWDTGETAFAVEFWAEVFRVLKPGAHLAAFSGTRTYHRMACAIEDAGFEIRDQLAWTYGSGFPKSHDVSKAIDKAAGAERNIISEVPAFGIGGNGVLGGHSDGATMKIDDGPVTDLARQWQGWGTALKPSWEPICLARKPLSEKTVAANVLRWGTGALNIDGCRVGNEERTYAAKGTSTNAAMIRVPEHRLGRAGDEVTVQGRFPANLIHDGSDEVLAGFPESGLSKSVTGSRSGKKTGVLGSFVGQENITMGHDDNGGSAARFFYTAKADGDDRLGSKHPTVKPVDLMQWLCRLITPPGGVVLDCFAGTGTTGEAAWREGFTAILMEREEEYQADIRKRMSIANQHTAARKIAQAKPVIEKDPDDFFNIEEL